MQTTFRIATMLLMIAASVIVSSCSKKSSVGPDPTPRQPVAPANLQATTISTSQIKLSWTDNSSDEDGFEIEQTSNGAISQISALANSGELQVTGLAAGETYNFRVRAYNRSGASIYSDIATATTVPDPVRAPSGLLGVYDFTSRSITLVWVDNTAGLCAYEIEQTLDGVTSTIAVDISGADRRRIDNIDQRSDREMIYQFRVRAKFSGVQPPVYSAYTTVYSVRVAKQPDAPRNVTAAAVMRWVTCGTPPFVTQCPKWFVTMSWTDVDPRATAVRVSLAVFPPGTQFAVPSYTTYSGSETSTEVPCGNRPAAGTKYVFRVQVTTPDGLSPWSTEGSFTF